MNVPGRLSLTSIAALGLLSSTALAQTTDPVPLKHWSAPQLWQATTPLEVATRDKATADGTEKPQLTTPGSSTQLGMLVAITPCRLVDTRSTMPQPFGAGSSTPLTWAAGSTHSIPAPSGSCSLPAALAYSVNITVWPQPSGTILNWLSACPTGTPTATCSAIATLTAYEGGTSGGTSGIVCNAAVVPANSAGSFDVYVTNATWVIIDVNGYYISPTALTLAGGSASAPSMTFGTDTTTGIYSSGTGTVNVATAGIDRLTVSPNGNVGIGTASPAQPLEVNGTTQLDSNLNLGGNIYSGTTGLTLFQSPNDTSANTSVGLSAMQSVSFTVGNPQGSNNTAVGNSALASNGAGFYNTAIGSGAAASASASFNTAIGYNSMHTVTSGTNNTAIGAYALAYNTGSSNVAIGEGALGDSASQPGSGGNNIAIGAQSGLNILDGTYNIDIGNQGTSGDAYTIRIGSAGNQNQAFIAGITGINVSGVPVLVSSSGQLGVASSSRRYKEDIQDMGDATADLMRLRPVTFRYKQPFEDGSKPLEYGLIAEEVAEVYPDLVARSADGKIETVKYQLLDPMLLNEVQKQHATITEQKDTIAAQQEKIAAEDRKINSLEERLARVESLLEKAQ